MPLIPPQSVLDELKRVLERADAKEAPVRDDKGEETLRAQVDEGVVSRFVKSESTNQQFEKDDLSGGERWKISATQIKANAWLIKLAKKG